jgi:predicted DNA-binding ribbon-helix-helix protein
LTLWGAIIALGGGRPFLATWLPAAGVLQVLQVGADRAGLIVAVFEECAANLCTRMVYTGAIMALAKRSRAKSTRAKQVRRSVTLPPKIAKQVESLARERDLSDNRVLVELIEQGIEARQQKEKMFFQLAERFRAADDPEQVKQLGNQLGRFVFGE